MSKKVISFFLLYVVQLLATSCCDCNKATYERSYNGLNLTAWDTSGFQNMEVGNDPVPKNSFGLGVSIEFQLKQIAYNWPNLGLRSAGFASANAFSCDCVPDEYIIVDPILSIRIEVMDTQNEEVKEVTNNFTLYGYDGERISIDEFFKIREEWHDGFQLDMSNYEEIPDSSIFMVTIELESGTTFMKRTKTIVFE